MFKLARGRPVAAAFKAATVSVGPRQRYIENPELMPLIATRRSEPPGCAEA